MSPFPEKASKAFTGSSESWDASLASLSSEDSSLTVSSRTRRLFSSFLYFAYPIWTLVFFARVVVLPPLVPLELSPSNLDLSMHPFRLLHYPLYFYMPPHTIRMARYPPPFVQPISSTEKLTSCLSSLERPTFSANRQLLRSSGLDALHWTPRTVSAGLKTGQFDFSGFSPSFLPRARTRATSSVGLPSRSSLHRPSLFVFFLFGLNLIPS